MFIYLYHKLLFCKINGVIDEVVEIKWNYILVIGFSRLLQYWLVDGWFPIFLWLGFAFLGAVFFRMIFKLPDHFIPKQVLL